MAFSYTVDSRVMIGNRKIHSGTATVTDATVSGDINTGLNICESMMLTHKGSAVETDVGVVNETFPVAGGAVTVVMNASDTVYWQAIGY